LIEELIVPYKVMLPESLLRSNDIERHAQKYLERCYPEREFIRVDGNFILSRMKRY